MVPTPPANISIIVIEDDLTFRQRLEQALTQAKDIYLMGKAASVKEAQALFRTTPADVMLVDLGLPDGSGIELIGQCRALWPDCQIMVLTVFGDENNIVRSIEAGATGYLLKDCDAEQVLQEIRSLHAGGSPISPLIARQILQRMRTQLIPAQAPAPLQEKIDLSPRELEVLNWITYGYNCGEIAEKLGISHHTVRTFIRRIYRKFEVNTRVEVVSKAREHGVLPR